MLLIGLLDAHGSFLSFIQHESWELFRGMGGRERLHDRPVFRGR